MTGGPGADRFLLNTSLQDFSGRLAQFPEDTVNTIRSEDVPIYHAESEFVRNYGRTNPYEDFATSFAYYVMYQTGEDYPYASYDTVTLDALDGKLDVILEFLNGV